MNMMLIIVVSQVATLKKSKMTNYTCHLSLGGKYIERKNQNDELQLIIMVHKATLTEKKNHDNELQFNIMIFKGCTIKKTTMTSATFLVVVSKFAKLKKNKMTNYVDHPSSWSLQNILKPQQQAWHSSLWFHKLQHTKKNKTTRWSSLF